MVILFDLLLLLKNIVPKRTRGSGHFRIDGGLSVFGTLMGRIRVFCISSISIRGAIHQNVSTVLNNLSPCARCCPRRRVSGLGFVAANRCNNVNSCVHRQGRNNICVVRPFRKVPTTLTKLGTNSHVLTVSAISIASGSSSRIDTLLGNIPGAGVMLGVRDPCSGGPHRIRLIHERVLRGRIACCNIHNSDMNCVCLGNFASGDTRRMGGTFRSLGGGRRVGSLVLSLHGGNNNLLRDTARVINVFIPGKGRIISAGKGVDR